MKAKLIEKVKTSIPEHDSPDPWYPLLQTQSYELYELMHLACSWHVFGDAHSSMSINKSI